MSRPKDLPSALQNWANANYSAGPAWGGTAQRQAPAGSALVPGTSLPAEIENYMHGNAFDAAQGALNAVGQIPALNWNPSASISGSAQSCISWSDADQSWWTAPGTATAGVGVSYDQGKTWGSISTAIATVGYDIAFDTSGNVVMSGTSNVQESVRTSYGSYAFVNRAAVTAITGESQVVYEPVASLWCLVGTIAATGGKFYTSISRATWTLRTTPAAWTTYADHGYLQMGVGNGIIVVAKYETVNSLRIVRSTDGGQTWTNDQSVSILASGITFASAPNSLTRPVWSAVDAQWYIAANQTGTRKTVVLSSPDGVSWSVAATLTTNDAAFVGLACLGALLVATNDDGRIFASFNKGVTWYRCGYVGFGTNLMIRAGGGGLAVLGGVAVKAATSARFGLPSMVA